MSKGHAELIKSAETNEFHERVERILSLAFHGSHNVPGKIHLGPQEWMVEVNVYGDLSTFDGCALTFLVFGAHDECLRLSIKPSGPRMVKIVFWRRETDCREGMMHERHPTLDKAVETWRRWKESGKSGPEVSP